MIDIHEFIQRQLAQWPAAAARYEALNSVEIKELALPCGDTYRVQFNPSRAVSTKAVVTPEAIANRPCFLCAANRPAEQISLPWEDLEVLLNPFPIYPNHLVIAAHQHVEQSLEGRLEQMRRLSRELPGFTVFFNGAKCGASAPDHFHFQAVESKYIALPEFAYHYKLDAEHGAEEFDPMVNAFCCNGELLIMPRPKHRPDCYPHPAVSPAALDLAGALITVSREDFEAMTPEAVEAILREVTYAEPTLYVGLLGENLHAQQCDDGSWEVEGVVIGKDFHWEQKQTFRYGGQMLQTTSGQLINRIGLEEYLKSVISSEMSAEAPLQLLCAHAVISRSWALAQLRSMRGRVCRGVEVAEEPMMADEIRTWQDRDDHEWFDLCSDDHCQRYQGITRQSNPEVERAVELTRGQVLVDSDGLIADCRFSKCCGGRSELFEVCWQPRHHSYLESVECPHCNTNDTRILRTVLNDFDYDSTPDFFSWEVAYIDAELTDLIRRKSGFDFGKILAFRPLAVGPSGRIYRLEIVGEKRTMVVGKELIIRRWLSESHLRSSAFEAERVGEGWRLRGRGWGHGVGLCQIGAAVMAAKGADFREILSLYYPNSTLRPL